MCSLFTVISQKLLDRWVTITPFTIAFLDKWKLIFSNFSAIQKYLRQLTNFTNSYLSHRIIDSFPWILKWKIIGLKLALFIPSGRRLGLTKLVLLKLFFHKYPQIIVCASMLYKIFQYCWEQVLIHRILIGLEGILER